jgi:hypothetical protein
VRLGVHILAGDSCSCLRDAILQNQDKMLRRTKTEIRSSLRIDTEELPSQLAPRRSPETDLPSKQVSTEETGPLASLGPELFPLSKDTPTIRPASTDAPSKPARNHLPSRGQSSAETSPSQKDRTNTLEKDPEPAPSPNIRPLANSSIRSSHSQSHSPSIVNLGRRSVVRKRLAEIQHSSTSGASTPPISHQSPTHTVPSPSSRERPLGNSEAFPEQVDSSSLINTVDPHAISATKQLTSPVSSGLSPSLEDRLVSPASVASDRLTLPSRPKSAFRLREEMRTRDSILLRHRYASERSESLASPAATSYISSQADDTVGALLDVMDVHAERQLMKTAELNDQLQAVQEDVRGVAVSMRDALSGHEKDSRHLAEIQTAVDDVRHVLAHLDAKQRDAGSPATTVGEINLNQAQIFQALEEIQAMLKNSTENSTVDGGATVATVTREQPSASFPDNRGSGSERSDLTDIRQKLDMLVELSVPKSDSVSSDPQRDAPPVRPPLDHLSPAGLLTTQDSTPRTLLRRGEQAAKPEADQVPQPSGSIMHNLKGSSGDEEIRNIKDALPHDDPTRAQLLEQQAESVRYLNELNTVCSSIA